MSSAPPRDFLQRAIPEIRTGGGRNIVELAKALHMPVETTRYKVKGMLKRGLSVHASVDYNKFGLTRYYAYFRLSEKASVNEKKLFSILADQAFLVSASRRLPSNDYICEFAFPRSIDTSFSTLRKFLRGLAEEGVLKDVSVNTISSQKFHMIQSEFFDLKHGSWRIDWGKLRKETKLEWPEPKVAEFDELDLMIVRELELDALTRLSDIATTLKTTLNNIFYHFHKHIVEGKLVDEYIVQWNGTTKQPVMLVQFSFNDLSLSEERSARSCVSRLPFLWSESIGSDSGLYIAQGMIHLDDYLDTLSYLAANLEDAAPKLQVSVLDAKSRLTFPLTAHLYKEGSWHFNAEDVTKQITKSRK
ncbi:MAG: hypothetical protein JRN52_00240 [Nitrososphaerota archaeon]|nr:hypothetical protein [Nitrososphaerota archaeon]